MASKSTPADPSTRSAKPAKLERKLRACQARVQELTVEVESLRADVRRLEIESAAWRKKARKHRSRLEAVREAAEVAIAEATAAARKRADKRAKSKIRQAIADHPRADHPRAEPLALRGAPALPEPSWTVTRLREAAREQGVAGYTRMRKDELLSALI